MIEKPGNNKMIIFAETMTRTIDITSVIAVDLRSRSTVHDLLQLILNSGEKKVVLDFSKVEFATRSFVDEFYNVFIKQPVKGVDIELANMPTDIKEMLEVVKQTQKGKPIQEKITNVETFDTVEEFCDFCSQLAF